MPRMVFLPSVGNTSVAGNSVFQEFYSLVSNLREAGEKVFWYVVVPSWVTDGLRGNDRLAYVRMDATRDPMINQFVGFPAFELSQYFSRRGGRNIVDGVLTDCSRFGLYLRYLLSDRTRKIDPISMFLWDREDVPESTEERWLFASNRVGCKSFVRSESERREISNLMGKWLNPSCQKLFLDNSIMWPVSYDSLSSNKQVKRGSDISLFISGEFGNYSNKRRILKECEKLFVSGKILINIASTVPQYKAENILPCKDSSFVSSFLPGLSAIEYDKEVELSHVFISMAEKDDELEEEIRRMVLGQIGIFPSTGMVWEVLGEGYPFLYNQGKVEEAVCFVEWIVDNYTKAVELVDPFVKKIKENRNAKLISISVWSEIKKAIEGTYRISHLRDVMDGKRKPLFNTVYSIASKLGIEFALDVFLDILEEHITWLKPWGNKGALQDIGKIGRILPTLYDIREMLDNLGWIDTCESQRIMLRKEREPLPGVLHEKVT